MSKKFAKVAAIGAVASMVFGAAAFFLGSSPEGEPSEEMSLLDQKVSVAFGPKDYSDALEEIDRDIAISQQRLDNANDIWLSHSNLAMGLLVRAQLTGSFEDLVAANEAIMKSVELAPEGSGPAVEASTINLSLHRYPQAETFIDRHEGFVVKLNKVEQSEMVGQRGEVAFYNGDYALARSHFEASHADSPSPRSAFRLGTWQKYCGDFDEAISLYEEGARDERFATPQTLAAYHTQVGALELQRGNWEKAAAYFRKADKLFPGHWLTRAHVAQMLAVEGKFSEAEETYSDIIRETGNPDVMMALADLREFMGEEEAAEAIRSRASAIFEERLQKLPEAYFDHGLDVALSAGNNKRALELAEANFAARPYGDAKMALARAHTANGRPKLAIDLLMEVKQSGWNSVELNLDLADAYRQIGDEGSANIFENLALAMNPRAMDPRAGLLAFGSH